MPVVSALMLALGIGLYSGATSALDSFLFKPLADVARPSELVALRFQVGGGGSGFVNDRAGYQGLAGVQASGAFRSVGLYTDRVVSIGVGESAFRARGLLVSDEYFTVLGSRPVAGILPGKGVGDSWLVISEQLWSRRFGADARIVGRSLAVDGAALPIVGVAPRGLSRVEGIEADVWIPIRSALSTSRAANEELRVGAIARLVERGSSDRAQERATAALRWSQSEEEREDGTMEVRSVPLARGLEPGRSKDSQMLLSLSMLSFLVLALASVNASMILLTGALDRPAEHAVRLALGASTRAMLGVSAIHSIVVVVPGVAGAAVVSALCATLLRVFWPEVADKASVFDGHRGAVILVCGAAFAFTLLWLAFWWGGRATPLWFRARHGGGRLTGAGPSLRRMLVIAQTALSHALLLAAFAFAMSWARLDRADVGVDRDNTVEVDLNLPSVGIQGASAAALYQEAIDLIRALPHVKAVAVAAGAPFRGGSAAGPVVEGKTYDDLWGGTVEPAYQSAVGPGFMTAVGAALSGRDFTGADVSGAPRVAIINDILARHLWPDGQGIGRCLVMEDRAGCVQVVGVVRGTWRFSFLRRNVKSVFVPIAQAEELAVGPLYVKTDSGQASAVMAVLAKRLQKMRGYMPAVSAMTLRQAVEPQVSPYRLAAAALAALAAIAVVLAAVGTSATVSVIAALRRRDTAIATALGAPPLAVATMVAGEPLGSTVVGLVVGTVAAGVAGRSVNAALFRTSLISPGGVTLSATLILLISVASAAIVTAAALRRDLMSVLKEQ